MSISSVSQMIKKRTGKSYSDHLLEIRICKAQELLRLTNESIEAVSYTHLRSMDCRSHLKNLSRQREFWEASG